jgi:hypothetical protein
MRFGVLAVLMVLAPWSSLEAAPIEVRFVEGAAHGLLLVRSVSGETPSWARPSASSPPSWGWRRPTKSASS